LLPFATSILDKTRYIVSQNSIKQQKALEMQWACPRLCRLRSIHTARGAVYVLRLENATAILAAKARMTALGAVADNFSAFAIFA
jgi:hypothetical protein